MEYNSSFKRNLFYIISVVVGGLLFVGAVKKVGFQGLLGVISRLSLMQFAILVLVTMLYVLVSVWRWSLILKTVNCRLSWLELFQPWLAGFAFCYLTPAAIVGGEPLRLRILKEKNHHLSWAKGAATIFIDKGLDWSAYLLAIIIGLVFLFWRYSLSWHLRMIFLLSVVFLAGVAVFLYYRTLRGQGYLTFFIKFFGWQKTKIWQKINAHFSEMEEAAHHFLKCRNPMLWPVVFLTLLKISLYIFRVYLIILFLGNSFALMNLIIVVGLGLLVCFIPLPGSLGSLEASQSFVFGLLGLGAQRGLAYALVFRSLEMMLVVGGIGVVLHLGLKGLVNNGYFNKLDRLKDKS